MGATQSSSEHQPRAPGTNELNQQIIHRLRALEFENKQKRLQDGYKSDKDYVMVQRQDAPPPYESMGQDVSVSQASAWERELLREPKNQLALAAFTSNAAKNILRNRSAVMTHPQSFNVTLAKEGNPVTNQKRSGRCWLFASTNVFRIPMMVKYNLAEFQLSQAYLFFWDKLEKANYFLESVLDTLDEPLDGRLLQALMAGPVGDGGQWDMVANLVQKYGLVPHDLYPDAFNAEDSSTMSSLITTKLREDAVRLRKLAKASHTANEKNAAPSSSSVAAAKTSMLREIHQILVLMLGPPPSPSEEFSWDFMDKDGHERRITMNPLDFASSGLSSKRVVRTLGGTDVQQLFSLVNDPRNTYNTLLTVDRLGNVYGGLPIRYVNVEMSILKSAAIKMLEAGLPVFFGSDVGKYSNSTDGVMDTGLYDYELGFNVRLGMSKEERLRTGESQMTHAMVLTGVQVEKSSSGGKYSTRWRVENSWSDAVGDKGYFVMSDEWMDEFVYQVVVHPNYVSAETRQILEQRPTVLPLWDPMGALA